MRILILKLLLKINKKNRGSILIVINKRCSGDHDSGAAALGDGLRGYGAPLVSSMLGKRRDYTDGFGLCSPGRWQPSMRRCADDTPSLAFAEALGVELLKLLNSKLNIRELMFKLAAGKVTAVLSMLNLSKMVAS